MTVQLSGMNGQYQTIHYLCSGPLNSSFPVIIFESDGSHGMLDFLGLQMQLTAAGKRSCIWDKVGLGYSDNLFVGQDSEQSYYHQLLTSIGEQGPFIFVAWGGGGSIVYSYALLHPEMVHSLVFLDVGPMNGEWYTPYVLKNWTRSEYEQKKNGDIEHRINLLTGISSLLVPTGLIGLVLPLQHGVPADLSGERRWYFLTDKTWITQRYYLHNYNKYLNAYKKVANATIHIVTTAWNETIVKEKTCIPQRLDETLCNYEIAANAFWIKQKLTFVHQNGGTVTMCSEPVCDLGYYVFTDPQYTINTLARIYKF